MLAAPYRRQQVILTLLVLLACSAVPAYAQRTGQVGRPTGAARELEAATIIVNARQTGANEVTVTWNAVNGATSYFIGRLAPPAGWQRINVPNLTATRYVDRNVEPGRTYRYQVAAIMRNGTAGRRFTSDSIVVREGVVEVAADEGEPIPGATDGDTPAERLEQIYETGARINRSWWQPGALHGKKFWLETAEVSGFDEATLRARWKEIAIAAQLYQHIFRRAPTKLELDRQLAAQRAGKSQDEQWRELAQSAAREREHGAFAPSPMTMEQARGLFGWRHLRAGEQCFGGLGPGCTGTLPPIFEWAQPRWQRIFRLPDGTEMGYVEIGVAIGSILHDNACMDAPQGRGLACNGYVPIDDLTKHAGEPAAIEWNKAGWNVIDGRGWRHVFGPYPRDLTLRRKWYDDLRTTRARRAMMANVLGPLTLPILDQPYKGVERRASRVLSAPSGTTLDGTDGAFCADRRGFKRTESPIAKAPAGICW